MIHLVAGLMLSVAGVTLVRNALAVLEQGNRGSATAHFAVAAACFVGAARAWWRWRRDTAKRLAKERARARAAPEQTALERTGRETAATPSAASPHESRADRRARAAKARRRKK